MRNRISLPVLPNVGKSFMVKLTSTIIILIITSCSRIAPNQFEVGVELRSFVVQFFDEAEQRHISVKHPDLIVSIEDLPKVTLVYGMTYYTSPLKVVIDKDFYRKNCKTEQGKLKIQFVLFHEFGHAILERSHIEANSIMNARTIELDYYSCNQTCRNTLITELFQKRES